MPDQQKRIEQFMQCQQAVQGEVHWLKDGDWLGWLQQALTRRGLYRVLVGTGSIGRQVQAADMDGIQLTRYAQPIEHWKEDLFNHIDVSITGCKGAIAATGSLILWPNADEPRLMSLVPPVHMVILQADKLYDTLADAMQHDRWAEQMPTNALLLSGPSKTADIEQTLAYGIHGPEQLITLIIDQT